MNVSVLAFWPINLLTVHLQTTCMVYSALPVGCRASNSLKCHDGMCLPSSVTCDGVQYCSDGSTFDLLCCELYILQTV